MKKMILAHNISVGLIDTKEALSTAKRKEFERLKKNLRKKIQFKYYTNFNY